MDKNEKRNRLVNAEENAFRRQRSILPPKAEAKNLIEMADSLSQIEDMVLGISNLNKNFELLSKNILENNNSNSKENKIPVDFSIPPVIQIPKNLLNKNTEKDEDNKKIEGIKEQPRETLNVDSMFKSIVESIQVGFSSLSNKEKNGIPSNNNSTSSLNNTKIENNVSNPISQINDLDSKLIKIELPFDDINDEKNNINKKTENSDIPTLLKTNSILENLSKNILETLDKTLSTLPKKSNKESVNVNPTNPIERVLEKQTVNNTIKEIQQIDTNNLNANNTNSNINVENLLEKTNNYFSKLENGINLLTNELSNNNSNSLNSNKKIPNEIIDSITLSNKSGDVNNLSELDSELDKKINSIQNLIKSLKDEDIESQQQKNIQTNTNIKSKANTEPVTEVQTVNNVNNTTNSINEKNISNEENVLNKISELVNSLNEKNILQKETVSELISKISNVKTDEKSSILDIKNVFSDIVKNIEKNTENVKNTQTNVLDKNNISNTISDVSYSKSIQNTISDISNTLNNELNKITDTFNVKNLSNETNKRNETNVDSEKNILNQKNNENNTSNVLTDVKKVLNSIEINSKTKLNEFITNTKNNVLDTINTANVSNETNTMVDKIKELSNNIYNENTKNTANKTVENLTNTKNEKNVDKENIRNKENLKKEDIITNVNTKDFLKESLKNIQNSSNNETNTTNIENRKNVLVDDSDLMNNIQKLENEPIQLNSILKNDSQINNGIVQTNQKEIENSKDFNINPLSKLNSILEKFNKNSEVSNVIPNSTVNPNISTNTALKNTESNISNNELLLSKKNSEQFPIANVLQNITDTLNNLSNIQNKSNTLDTSNPNFIGKENVLRNTNKVVETNNITSSNSIESIKRIEETIERNKTTNTSDNLVEIKKLNSNISDNLPEKLGLALMNNSKNNSINNSTSNEGITNTSTEEIKIDTSKLEELSNKNIDMQTELLTKLLSIFENGIKVSNFEKSDGPIVFPFQNAAPQTERSVIF